MKRSTELKISPPENGYFRGVNPFANSTSLGERGSQSSGFHNIDDLEIPTLLRRSGTYPSYQGRGDIMFAGDPQATLSAAPTFPPLETYGSNTTTFAGRLNEDRQRDETQENHGGTGPEPPDGPPPYSTPYDMDGEDFIEFEIKRTLRQLTGIPRLVYVHLLLLRLPYFYYLRFAMVFWGAYMPELMEMALLGVSANSRALRYQVRRYCFVMPMEELPAGYLRLMEWGDFIDSLKEEWKTLNIVSVLLVGAIVTMLQSNRVSQDPVTQYLAFCSLICTMTSLLHGCILVIRSSRMQKGYKAVEWAWEAQRRLTAFWNVWVMLSLPLFWLVWSIATFTTCVMTFMWRSRISPPENFSISPSAELGARICIAFVLGMAGVYTLLIFKTFRRYGMAMDRKWVVERLKCRRQQMEWSFVTERAAQLGDAGEDSKSNLQAQVSVHSVSEKMV